MITGKNQIGNALLVAQSASTEQLNHYHRNFCENKNFNNFKNVFENDIIHIHVRYKTNLRTL